MKPLLLTLPGCVLYAANNHVSFVGLSKAKSEPTAKHREGSGCSSDSEESIDQGKPARKSDTAILSHKVDAGEEVSEDSDVGGDSINIISRRMAKRSLTMKAKEVGEEGDGVGGGGGMQLQAKGRGGGGGGSKWV